MTRLPFKNPFAQGHNHTRLGLEVRPDGLAWACRRSPGALLESGFAPCTPAQRQGRLLTLVDELGLKKPLVSLVLSPGQYQVFQLDQPGVEPEELADAVRWKLKDLLDYRLDEAVVDTFPFPVAASRGRGQLLNAVSARKGMVQELIALVKGGQLQLLRIDIAELALRNLLLDRMPANRTNALVYLREQQGVLIIAHGGMLHMARRLDISLEQLRDASTQERAMQSLGLEIQRSMDYFESQLRQVPPRAVHVTGHPQALPLTDMLSGNLGVQVVEFDWQHLTGEVPPDLRSCLAIGAILPVPEMTA